MLISDLITQIRSLSNMEIGAFISDAEILAFINQAHISLYNKIVLADENFFITSTTLSGATISTIPDNCYKIVAIELPDSSTYKTNYAKKVAVIGQNRNSSSGYIYDSYKYSIMNNSIVWSTNPSSAIMYYIPYPTLYTAVGNTVNYPFAMFQNFYIYTAVYKCLAKEESPNKLYIDLANQEEVQIISNISNRDKSTPSKVIDCYPQGGEEGLI